MDREIGFSGINTRNKGKGVYMYKVLVIVLIWGAIHISSLTSWATTYYVDKNNANASNSNSGTENSPWLTIQHAVDIVKAGDSVYIRSGIYAERVDLTGSNGTEGRSGNETDGYITYEAFPGDSVILDGTGFTWGAGFMSGVYTEGSRSMNYIKIKGLTIGNYPAKGIVFDMDKPTPPNSTGSNHIIIENCIIYGSNYGVLIDGGDEAVNGEAYQIVIRNNRVFNCVNHGIKLMDREQPGYINRMHIYDAIVEGNTVYNNGHRGIHASTGAYKITIKNNIVYNNKLQGISTNEIWDSVIENNTVYANGQGPESEDEGIVIWSSKNISITDNKIYDNSGFGLKFWEDLSNTGSSPTVENNVIFKNHGGGLEISADVNDGKIYNNTFASNQGTGLYISSSVSGHDVKNNIIYQNSNQISPGAGNSYNYNLYFPNVSFSLKGANSLSEDPLFANSQGNDFHLRSNSPAVDSGIDVGIITDIEKKLRPQGNGYDIGAYEYNEEITAPLNLRVISN